MAKSRLYLTYQEFLKQYQNYFTFRKKVSALDNISQTKSFPGSKFVKILKELIKEGFLEKEEEEFVAHLLEKAQCNFYIWAHKNNFVKRRIQAAKSRTTRQTAQLILPLDGMKPITVPIVKMPMGMPAKSKTVRI